MSDFLYKALRLIGSPFRYQCEGVDHLEMTGAALVVSNHQGAIGPIECMLSLPRRFYPWIIVDMVDPHKISDYLFKDFVVPAMHISGKFGKIVAKGIAKIALPLLQNIDGIPVDRHAPLFLGAFNRSLEILKRDGTLLIFPEDPDIPMNSRTGMRSFMSGFLLLCLMYKQLTEKDLPVIPVAVCPSSRRVVVGERLYFFDTGQFKQDRIKFANIMEKRIDELYINTLGCRL